MDRINFTKGTAVWMAVLALTTVGVSAANAQVSFTEVASSAGVQFHQESEVVIPIGGGGVWADFDRDGDDDLYALQATGCNRLFANDGSGNFTAIPNAAGAGDCASVSHGAAVADYDNDGDQDIYVTNYGQNHLYQNQLIESGSVSFVDVTVAAGMGNDGANNSASAAWGDFDGDSFLDLVVVHHILYMPWDEDSCKVDLLYRNKGNSTFAEIGAAAGIDTDPRGLPGCGLAVTWSDFDMDNDVDLFIVNDFGEVNVSNRLYRNDGPDGNRWRFTDVSKEYMVDYPMFGMGIAIGDFDQDGDFDYYSSDIGPNNFAINMGDGKFSEVAALTRTVAADPATYGGAGLVSWGAVFFDVDNDGWDDLFVANGGGPEDKWPGIFGDDYQELSPNSLFRNMRNRTFMEVSDVVGIDSEGYHRAPAVSDIDDDGDVDLYVGVLQGDNLLYRNDSNTSKQLAQGQARRSPRLQQSRRHRGQGLRPGR